jgi:hypothetical protein
MGAEQYQAGTVTVTNGSQIWVGFGTDWQNELSLPCVVKVGLDGESTYSVAAIISATRLHLSANYNASTNSGLSYMAMRSWTTNRSFWRPLQGDNDWAEILSQETVDKIDTDIGYLYSYLAVASVENQYNPFLTTIDRQILLTDDMILASGNVTITLASASSKQAIKIGNRSLDANASILIQKSGGDTIENNATLRLLNKYDTVTLIGDGTNTHIQF